MSSPAPSASVAARGKEVYGNEALNIIPPRPPKRPGMPKLQLPSQNVTSVSQLPLLKVNSTNAPPLQLAIPSSHTFAGLNLEADEGYEGSAGTTMTAAGVGGTSSTAHGSIYPDTVPFGGNGQAADPLSLTNDLRRAIGRLSVDESQILEERSSERSGMKPSSSNNSIEAKTPFVVFGSSSGASTPNKDASNTAKVSTQELEEESELKLKGNLEVMDRLGEGASGEVRKARYKPTGMIMAMKTISTSPNPAIHRQILRELAFNRSCHSEYIVRYYGAFLESEDTSIVICMENCEAGSLDGIYKRCKARNGRMGEKILAKIAESGLKGLAYLHQRKIIHRDIKPSNILVTRQGQIKLCDFGVSGELINSMAGTFTGTSYYMAPERIRGLPYNITSDVWSLGLTILELASNRFPFPPEGEPALGPIDLLSYIVSMKTPELRDDEKSGVKWTKAFKDFLDMCLEKDGIKRYGPVKMLNHPFIKKSIIRIPQPNLAKFVAEVWGWPFDDVVANINNDDNVTNNITLSTSKSASISANIEGPILENVDVPGIGRVASLRRAPAPNMSGPGSLRIQVMKTPASSLGNVHEGSSSTLNQSTLDSDALDSEGRTAIERAQAKKREADIGLVGSPTVEF